MLLYRISRKILAGAVYATHVNDRVHQRKSEGIEGKSSFWSYRCSGHYLPALWSTGIFIRDY